MHAVLRILLLKIHLLQRCRRGLLSNCKSICSQEGLHSRRGIVAGALQSASNQLTAEFTPLTASLVPAPRANAAVKHSPEVSSLTQDLPGPPSGNSILNELCRPGMGQWPSIDGWSGSLTAALASCLVCLLVCDISLRTTPLMLLAVKPPLPWLRCAEVPGICPLTLGLDSA